MRQSGFSSRYPFIMKSGFTNQDTGRLQIAPRSQAPNCGGGGEGATRRGGGTEKIKLPRLSHNYSAIGSKEIKIYQAVEWSAMGPNRDLELVGRRPKFGPCQGGGAGCNYSAAAPTKTREINRLWLFLTTELPAQPIGHLAEFGTYVSEVRNHPGTVLDYPTR